MQNVIRMLNVGGLLAVAIVASPFAVVDQAHAYACKGSELQGAVVQKKKIGSRIAARKDWESRAKDRFDLSWSVWAIAEDKSITCSKVHGKQLCIASARPCNYVVQ